MLEHWLKSNARPEIPDHDGSQAADRLDDDRFARLVEPADRHVRAGEIDVPGEADDIGAGARRGAGDDRGLIAARVVGVALNCSAPPVVGQGKTMLPETADQATAALGRRRKRTLNRSSVS